MWLLPHQPEQPSLLRTIELMKVMPSWMYKASDFHLRSRESLGTDNGLATPLHVHLCSRLDFKATSLTKIRTLKTSNQRILLP